MVESPALGFKERGNVFFKAGNFEEAAVYYSKAETASSKDHVYPSNLSAALFELGNYESCFDAICRSWRLLTAGDNPTLALRLSARLAKTICQGLRRGAIPADKIKTNVEMINSAELFALQNDASDAKEMWLDCRHILNEPGDSALEPRRRFCDLSMFRKSVLSDLEYFTVGMDHVLSLIHNWGPQAQNSFYDRCPLNLNELPEGTLSHLSFFLGGVGDARHVYGTLIGAHKEYKSLSKSRKTKFRMHITLLDVHPGALARDLCIMMLVDDLCKCDAGSLVATEIRATLFYTYVGTVMPPYCHDRLQRTITLIKTHLSQTPPQLPNWFHVSADAIPGILDALTYWSTLGPSTMTVPKIMNMRRHKSNSKSYLDALQFDISPAYRQNIENSYRELREDIAYEYDHSNPERLSVGWAKLGVAGAQKMKRNRAQMIEGMFRMRLDGNEPARMHHEQLWYEMTGVFIPPQDLWARHPDFKNSNNILKSTDEPVPRDTQNRLKAHVEKTWKPNPTLVDRKTMERTQGAGRQHNQDMFDTPRHIWEFLVQQRLSGYMNSRGELPDAPAFSHVSAFFDEVVQSLMALKGRVKLEMLCGELTQELSKIRWRADQTRPAEFPRLYSRAYLSNVPDYTHGPLNTILHALPIVQCGPKFGVASNCQLNSGLWSSHDEFFYTYTLLHPKDIPRYLGCTIIRKEATNQLAVFGNTATSWPLSKLASRQELIAWVSRVLVYCLVPGSCRSKNCSIKLPNNLVAFFALLCHLPTLGYPSHWLAEFVQSLLNNTLVTAASPYLGAWPIPVSDHNRQVPMRKVQLHPWMAEMETIVATAHQGFPFSINLPSGFVATYQDIGVFEATVTVGVPLENIRDREPVISVLLYKSTHGTDPDSILAKLPKILDGGQHHAPAGSFFVLTSLDVVEFPSGKIRFRLNRKKVHQMVNEGTWLLTVYRTDIQAQFTYPVPASCWKEISPLVG